MATKTKTYSRTEFGDFQTPIDLCRQIFDLLEELGVDPQAILEPTCGKGSLLQAALERYNSARVYGFDINHDYVEMSRERVQGYGDRARVESGDFFKIDWKQIIGNIAGKLLVIGNPPWVTNATLSSMNSLNLPQKSNFQNRSGFDSISGKANFDVSEWMLIKLIDTTLGRPATIAMLCKVAVARKTLFHFWKNGIRPGKARIFAVNAKRHFNASVEGCLFVCHTGCYDGPTATCDLYADLDMASHTNTMGFLDGRPVADVDRYMEYKHLDGQSDLEWRSGVKHDRADVMEFTMTDGRHLVNGLGVSCDLKRTSSIRSSRVPNWATVQCGLSTGGYW